MANYEYVTWQPDDEVTSTKLKQMSDNQQWVNDNMLVGQIHYLNNNGILPADRTVGTKTATRVHGFYIQFDSMTGASAVWIDVPYPAVFTFAPIIVFSITSGREYELGGVLTTDVSTERARIKVFHRDGRQLRLIGRLNIIVIGY